MQENARVVDRWRRYILPFFRHGKLHQSLPACIRWIPKPALMMAIVPTCIILGIVMGIYAGIHDALEVIRDWWMYN